MKHGNSLLSLLLVVVCSLPAKARSQDDLQTIADISLDSLLNIDISTAAKYGQPTSEAAASVTIVTAEDIERYGYRTLGDVFMAVRGFYTSYDRNYVYLGVRGFGRPTDYNDRILLLINGHTTNEDVYGSAGIGTDTPINLEAVERIEIVRGPGSALYGTSAMFAVVNVITKEAQAIQGLHVSTEAGSYGRLQGSILVGTGSRGGAQLSVSGLWADIKGPDLYYKEYDAPSTNHGLAGGADWEKYYGWLAKAANRNFTLQGMFTSREKGIPTGVWETIFNDRDTRTLDQQAHLELTYDAHASTDKSLSVRGYVDSYYYKGWFPYDIMTTDDTHGLWLGTEVRFRWDLTPGNRLTLGAEHQNHLRASYRYWDANTVYFDGDFPFNTNSLYLQDEYQLLDNLSFTAGIRWDQYSTVGGSTTPRGGVIYDPARSTTLKLLWGEAFRAPNVYEAHYDDPVSGYKPNPDLEPERIRTLEVVWEQRLMGEFLGIISLYSYRMKNLIDQEIDPSDDLIYFKNVGEVKAQGLELELNARMKMGLSGYASYVYQNARDAHSDDELTNSPGHAFKLGLSYPLLKSVRATTQAVYETDRITVYGTRTKPFLLTNLNLLTQPLFHHMRLSLLIRNLFNEEYRNPGGYEHVQDAIAQDRRNFIFRVTYEM
jgi:outer membrane receptor for ferrienterochelin and colicins